jgi:trigger factor
MNATQKKLPKSQIEINFELDADEFKKYTAEALEHLKKHVKVDGFREGKAPANMVEGKLKPEALLMEAGDIAVRETYIKYINDNKLEVVGNPEISIVKIAQGSPFIFKAVATILPDVELPDYKEIAKSVKGQEISVTEEEVEESIRYLQKTRSKFSLKNAGAEKADFIDITYQNKDINGGKEVQDKFILGEGGFMPGFEDAIVGMKDGEEKEFSVKFPEDSPRKDLAGKEGAFKVKMISVQKMEVPEVNDEFAKQLGSFDTLVLLKENMKEGIKMEKTEAEKQRKRGEILEKIAEKAKFEMPEAMVEYEKERLLEDLKNKISHQIKISFEEYLATIKKTEAEIKETYQKEAEKRLKGFLILRQIGINEKIEVSDAEVDAEVEKSMKNYQQEHAGHNHGNPFDTAQGKIDREQVKEYTKGVIHNEKIFELLEKFN